MQYHLGWADELRELEKKFLAQIGTLEKEIHPEHGPTFIRIIEKKIALLKETLRIVEGEINVTLQVQK